MGDIRQGENEDSSTESAIRDPTPAALDLPRYVYEPLQSSQHIRVLTLCGASEDAVQCTINPIRFRPSSYQALSYVWGSRDQAFRAVVRDRGGQALGYIPLTMNLHHALRDLWHSHEVTLKVFWIDQICIDQ
jgi:hypothetical protein